MQNGDGYSGQVPPPPPTALTPVVEPLARADGLHNSFKVAGTLLVVLQMVCGTAHHQASASIVANGYQQRDATFSRALDILKEQERRALELGRTRTASRKGVEKLQEGDTGRGVVCTGDQGGQASGIGIYHQATEALALELPGRPLLTQDGKSPLEAYEPADPMDVGQPLRMGNKMYMHM